MAKELDNESLAKLFTTTHRKLVNSESVWLANFTSVQTQRSYSRAFRECCAILSVTNSDEFRALTSAEIILYREWLEDNGKTNRSIRNRLAAISSCFNYLLERQKVQINPVDGVKRPPVEETTGATPALSADQVKLLLQQPDTSTLQGARDSAILHFLFYTGARIGSPRTIKIKHFFQDKGYWMLRWQKKGGKDQDIPVHPELQSALLHYLNMSEHSVDDDAPLFAAIKKGNNIGAGLNNKTFYNVWNKYRELAGLPKQFTPHSSRATFATTADEKGAPVQDIQSALGHANITTTQAYIHSRKKHKDSAVFCVKY